MFSFIRNRGWTEKLTVLSLIVALGSMVIAIFTLVIDLKLLNAQELNLVG